MLCTNINRPDYNYNKKDHSRAFRRHRYYFVSLKYDAVEHITEIAPPTKFHGTRFY